MTDRHDSLLSRRERVRASYGLAEDALTAGTVGGAGAGGVDEAYY